MSQSQNKTNPSAHRDEHGHFTKGNSGGPGNPHARQVARLRKVMLECVTDQDMQEITLTLLDLAKQGNIQACRLLFSYLLGKPTPGVNPDQLDVEEWELGKQTAQMFRESPEVMEMPESDLTLKLARAAREGATERTSRQLRELLERKDAEDRAKEQRREKRRQKTQSKAKAPAGSPSANGDFKAESSPESGRNLEKEAQKSEQSVT